MTESAKTIHPFFSEKCILFPVILLSGIGIVMVYSASSAISMETHHTLFYFMKKQALFFGISLCVMFVTASFPYKLYKSIAYIILFAAIALLVAVLFPSLNIKAGGAHRWLSLGGLTFQPAEFAKLALIIFLGYSLSKKQEMIKSFSVGFVPHAFIFGLFACLIIIQPDFGTIVVLGLISWGMMFIAGVKITHLLSPTPLLIPVIYFLVYKVEYRLERILSFLNPWDDPYNTGYQITHSLKAFGSGGLFGKGIGLGMQKMHYLPEPHTDFIFSIIGEELGLIGVLAVLSLYLILLLKGISIAKTSKSDFGAITATGLTIYIGVQVIINTGVALGVLPTKGLTLPFISYGGTSLVINMAAMGILMNIGASQRNEPIV
ncbi:MAG: putative lipid II flippase FtsW [Proteobacteria bacterium]|nr:putative lipid II flippase FtsW [Pseudomonadota bacterium]MBU1585579.1 putative lipid II flippase FtsW [Pseudomonadota bacterium]MBU2455919.1 putative lipid II flippase FtsW [Pseudomonadota bacterium]MBU2628567.1 putative lipid II flippase FtsW [Pseudomonadota bacterium]